MSQLLDKLAAAQDAVQYQALTWEGTFSDYLEKVSDDPHIAGTAYERLYDMILSYGSENYLENKEPITRYNFFSDPFENGRDAVFGLDRSLMQLVQFFKSAARGYGTEKRVLLLHGPVGSAKSTIVRLLKKGLEAYSKTDVGALYSFAWKTEDGLLPCPMNEDPLHLVPDELRPQLRAMLNEGREIEDQVQIQGDLCPMCRFMFREEMKKRRGRLAKDAGKRRGFAFGFERARSRRHRHLPAQGREEPGFDRIDRRHQLSQNRRIRQRIGSKSFQFRRRI